MTRPDRQAPPEPHRLLFVVTTSDYGGSELFLQRLLAGLDRERFAPRVCSLCPAGRVAREIAAAGIPVISLEMSERARLGELPGATRRLARLIDEHEVELVQSLLFRANLLVALAGPWSRQKPVLVAGERSVNALHGRLPELALGLVRSRFDRTVAVSEAVRRSLIERDGLPGERIAVVPNGVDAEAFRPRRGEAERAQLGIEANAFVIGWVGRLSAEKGLAHLLGAAAQLVRESIPVRLVVVGDGPLRPELERLATSLELEDRVFWLGPRSDVARILPLFDVFALPSLEEGSPNALLEAMACGLPCVATGVGGVPELLGESDAGLLVEPESAADLGAALHRLAADPALRETLGKNARRLAEGRFSQALCTRRHEAIYVELLEARRPGKAASERTSR